VEPPNFLGNSAPRSSVASTGAACQSPAATSNHLIKPPKRWNGQYGTTRRKNSTPNRTGVEGDLDSSQNKEGEKPPLEPGNPSIHPLPSRKGRDEPLTCGSRSDRPASALPAGGSPCRRRGGVWGRSRGGRRIQRRAVGETWEGGRGEGTRVNNFGEISPKFRKIFRFR